MDKWQELNSSTQRIGQSSQRPAFSAADAPGERPDPKPAPEPKEDESNKKAAGLSGGAKVGIAVGALAFLGIGGAVALGGGGDDAAQSPATSVVAEDTSADGEAEDGSSAGDAPDSLADADAPAEDDAMQDGDASEGDAGAGDVGAGDVEEGDAMQDGAADEGDAAPATSDPVPGPDASADPASPSSYLFADQPDLLAAVGADSPASPPGAPAVHSILQDGKLYLRGWIPSEQMGGLIMAAITPVMGEGNIVNEYVIDGTKPFNPGEGSPTYIGDTVLFAPGSSTVDPQFYPVLGPGLILMELQPTVVIEVVGHTDSQGDDASNLALSQARVDAVRDFMISQGGDPERIIATGKGETDPRADNGTSAGRATNRRVEFIITGFEFG